MVKIFAIFLASQSSYYINVFVVLINQLNIVHRYLTITSLLHHYYIIITSLISFLLI